MSATNAELRARIERQIAKWRPILGLESWLLDVRFDEAIYTATCNAKPKYEEATLTFNLPRIRRELPRGVRLGRLVIPSLEELVCHELSHCVVWKSNETAVSRVARSVIRAYRA